MLQFENKTPRLLKEGQVISIPKDVYHRIIKGDGNLIIKIKEY
jgi:quercetin dioxygenase-like cupin family protein